MFSHRATYLVVAELAFLVGVVAGDLIVMGTPQLSPALQWLGVSLIAMGFHFRDEHRIVWLAVFALALFTGLIWRNAIGEGTLWQLPDLKVIDLLKHFKEQFVAFFERGLPPPYGNLVASIVVGGRGLLSSELRENFIATGTLHLVAVSGYNVTIVLKIFADWLKVFSPMLRFSLGSAVIVAFAILVGGQASVVRAAILAWLFLFAQLSGRQGSVLPALVLTATAMVIHKPSILLHDIGFQLSFLAFFGLVYISPLLKQVIAKLPLIGLSSSATSILSDTLGAQIMVLPILLFHFGQLTPLSPIANFLILPLVPILTIAALVIGILGAIAGPTVLPIAYPLYPIAWYIVNVTEHLAKLPGSFATLEHWPWWLTVISYLAIYLIVSHFWKHHVRPTEDQT